MFKKEERISRKKFNEIFKISKNTRGSFFLLKKYQNTEDFGVSIVISKKIVKTSVERHKIKRFLVQIIKESLKNKQINGFFIFLLQKNPFLSKKEAILLEINQIFAQND